MEESLVAIRTIGGFVVQIEVQRADAARATEARGALKVALIGHGIQLSRTPAMHRKEGEALGLSYDYDLRDTALAASDPTVDQLLKAAEADGLRGVNITHPFKQAALEHLDHLSDAAKAVQAVNTVVFRNGKRLGHNTDYWGFTEAFRQGLPNASLSSVVLLGAGGAGGAVAHALSDLGVATLHIHDVSADRAHTLAEALRARGQTAAIVNDLAATVDRANGIVNATPVGMAAHPGAPIPVDLLKHEHWVADIIYFPLETALLRHARAIGCRTLGGEGMAVLQAVRAFELFTGRSADASRMTATFRSLGEVAA